MSPWPSWRFEKKLEQAETEDNLKHIEAAKAEAEEALRVSREQVAQVHAITEAHKPIRRQLRYLRERDALAEGFRRIIEEGR